MKGQSSRHMVDIMFTLALFCVFAICALMVVIMGADVYRKGTEDTQHNFDARTSLSYISTKLRQSDTASGILLETLEGTPALILEETVGGTTYRTWIYCSQGSLREVFTPKELTPSLTSGQAIMELRDLTLEELEEGILRITATEAGGHTDSLLYTPRCD